MGQRRLEQRLLGLPASPVPQVGAKRLAFVVADAPVRLVVAVVPPPTSWRARRHHPADPPLACHSLRGGREAPCAGEASWRARWSAARADRKSTRLNSSHVKISYAV